MAWATTLLTASFRGVTFDCLSTANSRAKALAVQQSPYANFADIDDMGNDPRKISLKALLAGDDYENYLTQLTIALDMQGSGELIHPTLGTVQAHVVDYSINHDTDTVDGCYIDINFMLASSNSDGATLFVPVSLPPEQQLAPAIILAEPVANLSTYQDQLNQLANPTALDQKRSLPNQIREGLHAIRLQLQTAYTQIDDLTKPPVWVGSILKDVTGIITDVPLDFDPMANWRRLINQVTGLADLFSTSDVPPLKKLGKQLPVAMLTQAATEIIKQQQTTPSLTPADLNSIRNHVRQNIQTSIDDLRRDTTATNPVTLPVVIDNTTTQINALKQAAGLIQSQIQQLIDAKPPMIVYTVPVLSSFYLIAARLYGDLTRVDELKRLNRGLVNPALITAGTRINAYAV